MNKTKGPRILFYDIETTPLQAWIWRCGDQVIRHGQLVDGMFDQYHIICISYCWKDGGKAKTIDWGYKEQNTAQVIEKFDKIIKQADITIGKNSDRFDTRHINVQRLFADLPGMPEWIKATDDLETQIRRHFGAGLASVSLDYVSKKLGYGGKSPMEFEDWLHICQKTRGKGPAALKKMIKYCEKDVEDTRALWEKVEDHIIPKYNIAAMYGLHSGCVDCGGYNLVKNGYAPSRNGLVQKFICKNLECGSTRTRATISRKSGKPGITRR